MIGRYARILRDPLAPILKGFAGKITALKTYNGQNFYEVTAENFGPKIASGVIAWKRGNHRAVTLENLELIEEEFT